MKKIGILRCFEVSSRCSGTGCLNAFSNKTASLVNLQLIAKPPFYLIDRWFLCGGDLKIAK